MLLVCHDKYYPRRLRDEVAKKLCSEELGEFPKADLNIAVFGTQSSGKSTLLNSVFGTGFPVLDTSLTRERCTKGVWLQHVKGINLIDTEGFDSSQRGPEERMFEKRVALFCLALADVVLINLWMNEVGRYEASHSHILKAIVRASQKLIASQQRKIVFVVRDCTEDADRSILRQDLHAHMQAIITGETGKSAIRFSLEYFMMSHYFEDEKAFKRESKELLKTLTSTRKSSLANYSGEDRLVYMRKLWEKICSPQSDIDLRTVEDALRDYALERVKRETLNHMDAWLEEVKDLSKFKTYGRFKQAAYKEARSYFLERKPKHLKDSDVQTFLEAVHVAIEPRQNKQFMSLLLPLEEDRLVLEEYQACLDSIQGVNSREFKGEMQKRRRNIEEAYKGIVKGLREYARMTRRFQQKIDSRNSKYEQLLTHIDNLFMSDLESALNEEADRQTKELDFNGEKLKKVIGIVEEQHKSEAQGILAEIWEKVVARVCNSTLIERIRSEGSNFSTASLGFLMGNQREEIVDHYRELQAKALRYLSAMMNFNCSDDETTISLEKYQEVKKAISALIQEKLTEQSRRFKITLVLVALLMYLCYSEFQFLLKMFGMSRKRLARWTTLYLLIMFSLFGVLIFRNRAYFAKFIPPA